jgi:hypothetical protein
MRCNYNGNINGVSSKYCFKMSIKSGIPAAIIRVMFYEISPVLRLKIV